MTERSFDNLLTFVAVLGCIGVLVFLSVPFNDKNKTFEKKLCKREFNQDLATVSIEHKSPVLHKGTKPNRILIICQ